MNNQKLFTTIVGAFFTVLLTFNISAQENKKEISSYEIFIEKTDIGVALKCTKGCAWTDLSFSLNRVNAQAVDEFGLRNNSVSNNKTDAKLANFLFTIKQVDKGFLLTNIEGSSWKKLNVKLEYYNSQAINAKGLIIAY